MLIVPITSYLISLLFLSVVQSFLYPFNRDWLILLGVWGVLALIPMTGLFSYFAGYDGLFLVIATFCSLCWVVAAYFSIRLLVQWWSGKLDFSPIGSVLIPIVFVSMLVVPFLLSGLFRSEQMGLIDFLLLSACFGGYFLLGALQLFIYEFGNHFTS